MKLNGVEGHFRKKGSEHSAVRVTHMVASPVTRQETTRSHNPIGVPFIRMNGDLIEMLVLLARLKEQIYLLKRSRRAL